jgi:hypothetical protein
MWSNVEQCGAMWSNVEQCGAMVKYIKMTEIHLTPLKSSKFYRGA